MNNKLFARIAAAAVGVSMLSTFVFADAPTIANGELSFMNGETNIISATVKDNAEYVTMMSYLISKADHEKFTADGTVPAPVDTNIIALDQVKATDLTTQLASVKLLESKLKTDGYTAAVVRTGDSNGGGNTWVIALAEDGKSYTITLISGVGKFTDATTQKTIANVAEGTVTAPTDTVTGPYDGVKFEYWATRTQDSEGNITYTQFNFAGATDATKISADTTLYAVYSVVVGDVDMDGKYNKRKDPTKMSYYKMYGENDESFVGESIGVYVIGDVDMDGKYNKRKDPTKMSYYKMYGENDESFVGETIYVTEDATFKK